MHPLMQRKFLPLDNVSKGHLQQHFGLLQFDVFATQTRSTFGKS